MATNLSRREAAAIARIDPPDPAASGSSAHAIRRVTLADFRCYRHLRVDIDPGPVVLTGPNGAGKTNLLEALSFLVPGRGLRRARLADAQRRDPGMEESPARPWAVAVTTDGPTGSRDVGTGMEDNADGRDKRVVRIDGETRKSQAALAEVLSLHWLTPQMDRLFVEGAAGRRRFLDRVVFGFDPAHAGRVLAYEHALRERARLLANARGPAHWDRTWLSALEETVAAKGVAVAAARLEIARRLDAMCRNADGPFPAAGIELAGEVEDWLRDMPALAVEDRFKGALEASRRKDAETGGAQQGPHRSDVLVFHLPKNQPADICSTGEQKALLIALVLGTAGLAQAEKGWIPVLLLDEVAAHLDETRRRLLFDTLVGLRAQVWLTGTEPDLFEPLRGHARFFAVENAAVTPVS